MEEDGTWIGCNTCFHNVVTGKPIKKRSAHPPVNNNSVRKHCSQCDNTTRQHLDGFHKISWSAFRGLYNKPYYFCKAHKKEFHVELKKAQQLGIKTHNVIPKEYKTLNRKAPSQKE